jgi:thioredoxin 1
MGYAAEFATQEPGRVEVDGMAGLLLLEFGAPWCPHCQRAQAPLQAALVQRPEVRHLKIEDGRGRPLGRSFRVKLWPTLILMRDGAEVARVTRPTTAAELSQVFTN